MIEASVRVVEMTELLVAQSWGNAEPTCGSLKGLPPVVSYAVASHGAVRNSFLVNCVFL